MNKLSLGECIRLKRREVSNSSSSSDSFSLRSVASAVGVSPTFLSDVELGRRMPSPGLLEALAEHFGLPHTYFEPWDDRPLIEKFKERTRSTMFGIAMGRLVFNADDKLLLAFADAYDRYSELSALPYGPEVGGKINVILEKSEHDIMAPGHPLNTGRYVVDNDNIIRRNSDARCTGRHMCHLCMPESDAMARRVGTKVDGPVRGRVTGESQSHASDAPTTPQ